MDDLINELCYGNIRPVEYMGGLTPEAAAIMKWVHEDEDRLKVSFKEQEKSCFTLSRMTALMSPVSSRKNASARRSYWGRG